MVARQRTQRATRVRAAVLTYATLVAACLFASACSEVTPPPPEIISLTPNEVSSTEETGVAVHGRNFLTRMHLDLSSPKQAAADEQFTVRIGETRLPADRVTHVDAETLAVLVPAGLPLGAHDVEVTSPTAHKSLLPAGLLVFDGNLLPVGSACDEGDQCRYGYCSDGFCCDEQCSNPCMACASAQTGEPDGICSWTTGSSPDTYESSETSCDGLDNDCDGITDVGCVCDYLGSTDGVCAAGGTIDAAGQCSIAPASYENPETSCDGLDNDCSGTPDEVGCTTTVSLVFDNAGIAEDLLMFPVLVTLTPANFDYSNAAPLGADLLFEDDDGVTSLAHEIDVWNPGGTSQVWVLVPQIDAGSITDHIFMTYGDINLGAGEDPSTLWGDYHAVWHLRETGSGANDEFIDSSPLANHGQGGGGTPSEVPVPAAGHIGTGQLFDGSDDNILVASSDNLMFTTDAVSIEHVASANSAGARMVVVGRGGDNGGYRTSIEPNLRVGWLLDNTLLQSSVAPTQNVFHHVVVTWDGATMRTFVDGIEDASTPKGGSIGMPPASWFIGHGAAGSPYRGIIDEVRVSNRALSAAWIAAQNRTIHNSYITFQ